jgi:hypothetical protein
MFLIQLLLPTRSKGGEVFGPDVLGVTRAELIEQFGGLTAYLRAPAAGAWTSPDGKVEEDSVVMIEVLAHTFEKSWWRAYSETLKRRFAQESIHVRAAEVETLD